ncbi:MAG: cell division protein ZapA [Lactobacillus sp.]|nr:cell division protein ZapA [Lactobacillus sp.]
MPEDKRRFKVKIAGEVYTIIGKAQPEHMDAVVKIVEQQLAEIKELMPALNNEKAAILLAINAVSDQLYKQEELLELKETKEEQ